METAQGGPPTPSRPDGSSGLWAALASGLALLALLVFVRSTSYLLFHSLAELFSVTVLGSIFIIAWNTRRIMDNNYLLFLGMASPFIGGLDLVHTLAYRGMGVFPGQGADLPTQLWIAARGVEASSFLLAPLFLRRRPRPEAVLGAYLPVTAALLGLILSGRFPSCYLEGHGLTAFKVGSEYAISGILLLSGVMVWASRESFDRATLRWLLLSLSTSVGTELSFTLYVDVYGFFNFLGHCLRIVSVWALYKALVESGLRKPYFLLFGNLKRSEEALRRENSELLRLQGEVRAKNARLEELDREKNRLLGMAAHDIRSPLAVIRMYADVLSREISGERRERLEKLLSVIKSRSEYSLRLVESILSMAAIESGELAMKKVPCDLGELVSRTVATLEPLALRKGIELRFAAPGVPCRVEVDALRFEEAMENLITNAVKFSPGGGLVEVEVRRADSRVAVQVRDSGQGIPAAKLKDVFKPFLKVEQGTAGEEGTGLGLAIVRKIVTLHGGLIEVESIPGQGSTFTITLPAPS